MTAAVPVLTVTGETASISQGEPTSTLFEPALQRALAQADGGERLPVIVVTDQLVTVRDLIQLLGPRDAFVYETLPGAAFEATPSELRSVATVEGVRSIHHDQRQVVHLDTATQATRAQAVWGAIDGGPISHPGTGDPIDGSGVGIAVVDSGIDASHPDLDGRVVHNVKVVADNWYWWYAGLVYGVLSPFPCQFVDIFRPGTCEDADVDPTDYGDLFEDETPSYFVEMDDTDTTSGHGTHVAGIVSSEADIDPTIEGAAPGASLYGFSVGEGGSIRPSMVLASYEWILENHDTVDPEIQVVTNSWGPLGGGAYDPDDPDAILVSKMVEQGITVIYSAGNSGGDGSSDVTGDLANHPAPGVISVANYDDEDTGTRDGQLDASSSRGAASDASTWPDLSAPGTAIRSTATAQDPTGWFIHGLFHAYPQFQGTLRFHLGDQVSASDSIEWILFTEPAAMYNAHTDEHVDTARLLPLPDTSGTQDLRYYGDVPVAAGPVHPAETSEQAIEPGDHLELTRLSGTANPVPMRIVAPNGDQEIVRPRFACEDGCKTTIDLHELFGSGPADGTWTITPAPDGVTSPPRYVEKTGTSMAAPHVAGIAALLLQAKPGLTPAQVEDILEDTAYKFDFGAAYEPDPANPDDLGSYDKGHGLVDARAAVEAALAFGS